MKYNLNPMVGVVQEKRKIDAHSRKIPILILRPENPKENAPGVLWLHGGGYFLGMKEMVHMGRAENLAARRFEEHFEWAMNHCFKEQNKDV